jgi:phosphatidylinositol glycan class V
VGFLRYWTISNLPLFLIAAPLMWALVRSAVLDFENKPASQAVDPVDPQSPPGVGSVKRQSSQPSEGYDLDSVKRSSLRRLALPQLVLSLVAFTSFHIQIINRIASGYPVWYLWLARDLSHSQGPTRQAALQSQASIHHPTRATHVFVRWMMMYAIVQGSLFANFLPPA